MPVLLGPVEGHVGLVEQLAGPLLRPEGDPDAGRHGQPPAGDQDGLADGVPDPPGDLLCILGPGHPVGHDDELVAPEPGHRVTRSDDPAEAVGHRHQQLVAGGVAEGVVDPLEPVQVEVEHGHVGLALHR
jgi:hypothetical protein